MSEVTEFCEKYHACFDGKQWASQYQTLAEVYDNCERGDWLLWMLRKANKINKKQAVRIAIFCAERVLPVFEKNYPDDERPRKAIETAKAYLKNPCRRTKRTAAAAADAAADAAERKIQADKIREIIPNPFRKGETR